MPGDVVGPGATVMKTRQSPSSKELVGHCQVRGCRGGASEAEHTSVTRTVRHKIAEAHLGTAGGPSQLVLRVWACSEARGLSSASLGRGGPSAAFWLACPFPGRPVSPVWTVDDLLGGGGF